MLSHFAFEQLPGSVNNTLPHPPLFLLNLPISILFLREFEFLCCFAIDIFSLIVKYSLHRGSDDGMKSLRPDHPIDDNYKHGF